MKLSALSETRMLKIPDELEEQLPTLAKRITSLINSKRNSRQNVVLLELPINGKSLEVIYGTPDFVKKIGAPPSVPAAMSPGYESWPAGLYVFDWFITQNQRMQIDILRHELTHYIDPKSYLPQHQYWDKDNAMGGMNPDEYINHPTEQDAQSSAIASIIAYAKEDPSRIPTMVNKLRHGKFGSLGLSELDGSFIRHHTPENRKRFRIRAYNALSDAGLLKAGQPQGSE